MDTLRASLRLRRKLVPATRPARTGSESGESGCIPLIDQWYASAKPLGNHFVVTVISPKTFSSSSPRAFEVTAVARVQD